jgi:hypothetical protein
MALVSSMKNSYDDSIMNYFFKMVAWLFLLICSNLSAADPTVLVAILARNKAHTLPLYLQCLERFDYDKQSITIYINTNNNDDDTAQILHAWADKHQNEYKKILFDEYQVSNLIPTRAHQWNGQRLKLLGQIRNRSMQVAKEQGCDYYFVADCDNFLIPETLRDLVDRNRPIIAPLLKSIPLPNDIYANFFHAATSNGYYDADPSKRPLFFAILQRKLLGTFAVPVVHCTYLIQSKYLDQLTYVDETPHHEFIVFSRSARKAGIQQYICNEREYGTQIHYEDDAHLSREQILERERELMGTLLDP